MIKKDNKKKIKKIRFLEKKIDRVKRSGRGYSQRFTVIFANGATFKQLNSSLFVRT